MSTEMTNWIFLAMGLFLVIVGIVIWAGKKISFVHGDEASKVQKENIKPYAMLLGIGVMLMGLGVSLYGVLGIFDKLPPFVPYIALVVFAGAGVLICFLAEKKYFH